jgi:hypothetical protein
MRQVFQVPHYLAAIRSVDEAVVIGVALSLSSSAFVLQLLTERGELTSKFGSATLGILLAQVTGSACHDSAARRPVVGEKINDLLGLCAAWGQRHAVWLRGRSTDSFSGIQGHFSLPVPLIPTYASPLQGDEYSARNVHRTLRWCRSWYCCRSWNAPT